MQFEEKFDVDVWRSGPPSAGGREYIELRVRDGRGKIVAYALCETDTDALKARQEFIRDFGEDR